VDAIVGATKTMTTIIADECTGCDLCPPVCPVDCISMVEIKPLLGAYVPNVAEIAHA
jgi:electron transport complex protein RnfB